MFRGGVHLGPKPQLEELELHDLESFKAWIRRDLDALRGEGERSADRKARVDAFLEDIRFDEKYHELVNGRDIYDLGEVAAARTRMKPSLISLDYTVTLERDARSEPSRPLARAARLTHGALMVRDQIANGSFPIDTFRDKPLNMDQFEMLFGQTLIPLEQGNRLVENTASEHIVVLFRGQAYRVRALEAGKPLSPPEILHVLEEIVAHGSKVVHGRIGLLTCCHRSRCAELRALVTGKDIAHAETLDAIDSALFILALDLDEKPVGLDAIAATVFSKCYANRWYDKSFQIAVTGNAEAGFVFNYACYLDGGIGIRFAADVQKIAAELPQPQSSEDSKALMEPLAFSADEALLADAGREVRQYVRAEQSVYEIDGLAKKFFKSMKISPDSSVQVAILLACRRFFGEVLNLRQFVSVRKYRGGTLDCPYVTTREIEAFLVADGDPSIGDEERVRLLRAAVASHKDIIVKTVSGRSPKVVLNQCLVGEDEHEIQRFREVVHRYKEAGFRKYVGDIFGLDRDTADVITSALVLRPETPLLGRPGVRLPYLTHFGLHYFMTDEHILLIYMPAKRCPDQLDDLHGEVVRALSDIAELLRVSGD